MTQSLTEQDRKFLKYEKRIGYVFAGLILSFGGFFNLIYFLLNKVHPNLLLAGLIDLGIILLAYTVCHRTNRKLNLDLKDNQKEIHTKTLEKKEEVNSYEAGSGSLHIPILGNLFPKLWGQNMKENKLYYLYSQGNRYEADKALYDQLKKGSEFHIHYARHSETILIISRCE